MNAPILDPTTTIIEHPGFDDTTATSAVGHHTVFTQGRQRAFLQNLQLFGNVRHACRAACVSAQTAYRARRQSRGFRLAWDAAMLAARGHAEATLADRAINGVEEAVFYHGEEVARRRRFDSRLLLAHLARLDRLEAREDVAEMLERFDECMDALEQGVGIDETLAQEPVREPAREVEREAREFAQEGVPPVPSCRNGEAVEEGEDDEEPALERRLRAMEAARPEHAVPLSELALGEEEIGLVEAAQLDAFEAGEPRWWEVLPEPDEGGEDACDPASPTHARGVSEALLWKEERD